MNLILIGIIGFLLGTLFGHKLRKRQEKDVNRIFYEKGLNKGYELGWNMKRTEHTNVGFIIGSDIRSNVSDQIDEIVRRNPL